jgi:hypothetical protein
VSCTPRSPFSDESEQSRKRSDDARETYSSLVKARRASRTRLRLLRGSAREEEEEADDGSVPTFCPHCHKEYRQNNSFFKHLYEHHPAWQLIAKEFNVSKHQQVDSEPSLSLLSYLYLATLIITAFIAFIIYMILIIILLFKFD